MNTNTQTHKHINTPKKFEAPTSSKILSILNIFVRSAAKFQQMSYREANELIRVKLPYGKSAYLQRKWKASKRDIVVFFTGLDSTNQMYFLQVLGLYIPESNFDKSHDTRISQTFNTDKTVWEIYGIEITAVEFFLKYAFNNSINFDKHPTKSEQLNMKVKASRVSTFGSGENWVKFWSYLIRKGEYTARFDLIKIIYQGKGIKDTSPV